MNSVFQSSFLSLELTRAGIGFLRRDNCLIDVADQAAAQRLLDQQVQIDWSRQLQKLLGEVCPVLGQLTMRDRPLHHYWSADETEWATDIMFRSPEKLAALYPRLTQHAISTFGSRDVMRFLDQVREPKSGGVDSRFRGEVVSDLRQRPEGVRIKHRKNANSIKMYDKQGSVLRMGTTVNDARDFRVNRSSETDPKGPKKWQKLRKGVVDLPRRSQISHAANTRYLTSLAAVDSPQPLGKVLDQLSRPCVYHGHRVRGLHPLEGIDARLLELLLSGARST